jgi:type IV pilus assembly protein PilA
MIQLHKQLAARRADSEEGFTLIELMVVVLIIAILIAIAIPTFLGARQRAQDRAAQSSLRNGLTASKTIFTDQEDYRQATVAALGQVEPSLTFAVAATDSTGPNNLSVDSSAQSRIVLAALSKSGECFYISDDVTGPGTRYFKQAAANGTTCNAAGAPASGNAAWVSSW